jgi:hypothetical protein
MSESFNFSDYWPKPDLGKLYHYKGFNPADQKYIEWVVWNTGENGIFFQEDYHDSKWTATWVMNYQYYDSNNNYLGVMETADIYPKYSYQFWANFRTTSFVKGYEIPWGGLQKVGDLIDKPLKISFFNSTFFTFPSPGRQVVKFEARHPTYVNKNGVLYNDVLEVTYDQTFGEKTAGARSWFAKDFGIVETQWRWKGQDIGDILPMTIRIDNGYIDENKYPVWT